MKNGDHPVSNSCASPPLLPRSSLRLSIHFFHSLIVMSPLLLETRYGQFRFVEDLVVRSKHEGYRAYTSDEAHNHSGLSVEKHSNNFVVSNDVLVLEVCKRCTDVVIVIFLPGYLHRSYRGSTRALVARIHHNLEEFDNRYCNSQKKSRISNQMIFLLIS